MKKKKWLLMAAATAATAMALAVGTFAWESVSQLATNEKEEVLNPGARLHDDFNGINKDVYVENFTDSEDGGMDVYARVRFYEYLELGKGAGQTKDNQAVSVIDGTKRDKVDTWYLHNPYDTDDIFHSYFEWDEGGGTTYMPTFNKNKENKDADINGTLEGKTPDDEIHYDDYVDYTDPQNAQKTDTAVYSDKSEEETHDVGPTLDAEVVTMSQWKRDGCPKGEF